MTFAKRNTIEFTIQTACFNSVLHQLFARIFTRDNLNCMINKRCCNGICLWFCDAQKSRRSLIFSLIASS